MTRLPIVLTMAVTLLIIRTAAEPAARPTPEVRAELKRKCLEAVRQLCDPGFPLDDDDPGFLPDADALRRCALESQDRLPAACRPLIAILSRGRQ